MPSGDAQGVGHKTSNQKRCRQVVRPVHGRCSSPASGFRHVVGALAHRRCAGPALDLRHVVGASAHRPCSSLSLDLQHFVGAPVQCRCSSPASGFRHVVGAPAHGRDSSSWPVLRRMGGARRVVRIPVHGRCSGLLSVLTAHGRYSGALSVPRQKNRRQAPSTTLYSAQHGGAADCLQPPLRSGFRQQLTPSVRLMK
jgi:hypothetical protein